MDQRPAQPPEGRLIASAAARMNLSIREAARRAGISYGRWRQIVQGYQNVSPGSFAVVRAPARTLAKMAVTVGVTASQMETEGGRPDAAEIMRDMPDQANPDRPAADRPGFRISAAEASRAEPLVAAFRARLGVLAAAGDPDPPGKTMFPAEDDPASAWDYVRQETADADERVWLIALFLVRRDAAAGLSGTA